MHKRPSFIRSRSTLPFICFHFLTIPVDAQDREVLVTVAEGTNVAAALSPDGQRLALDLQGTLWLLPAMGGEATAITDALGDIRQPTWGPDGRRIAFQSFRDGNWHIWSIQPDGTDLRQHTFGPYDDREPHWSDDGVRIVFSSDRSGNYDLWVLDVGDGALTQLTFDPANDFAPVWSPGNGEIAFVSTRSGSSGIWIRAEDGTERLLVRARGASGPSWSPDGSQLLYNVIFGGESQLLLVSARDTIAEPAPLTEPGADVFPFRASWFSPTEFVHTADGKIRRGTVGSTTAQDVPFRAAFAFTRRAYERKARDFHSTDPEPVRGIFAPAVSPSGDQVAFSALGDLWLLTIGDPVPLRLTNDAHVEFGPQWSRDGTRLVYSSDRSGSLDLWVRNIDTGTDEQLTDLPGAEIWPVWSPDGSQIAFGTAMGLRGDFRVIDVRTRKVRVLRDDLFAPSRASWSADGSTLAISVLTPYSSRFREGRNEVLLLPVAGGEGLRVTPLEHRGIGTRGTDGPVWSPDGGKMAFVSEGVLWNVEVDEDGRPVAPPNRLSSHSADAISWTGDSQHIVYQSRDGLWRVTLATGSAEQIPLELTWQRKHPTGVVVVHAGRFWDGQANELRQNVDIVIERHRVREILDHRPAVHRGRVVDAGERTVMPGLVDMHGHLGYGIGEALGRIWLSYGVTTVRDPSSDPYDILERREAVESGARIGPREFATGRLFDGTRIYYSGATSLDRGAQVSMELERADVLDYSLVKTYVRLPDVLQQRIIEFAHGRGIPVSSHELYPAVALGADHVEHIRGTSRRGYSPKVSRLNRSYDDVIQLLAQSGMTITPTIGIMGGFLLATGRDSSILADRRVQELYPAPLVSTLTQRAAGARNNLEGLESRIAPLNETVRRVVAAGGNVVAGTDAPIIPYGISLHTELEHYVDGGLTPREALLTATSVAAAALGMSELLGSVAVGGLADLVVVEGNPLENIKDARRVRVVIKNGEVFELEDLLRRPGPRAVP